MALPFAALAVGSALLGGALNIEQGRQQQRIAEENAATATLNAEYAKIAGADRAFRIRYAKRLAIGAATTAYAKGGVLPFSGSAADTNIETANQYELDALKAEIGGNVAASASLRQAHLLRKQGQYAMTNAYLSAGANLLYTGARLGLSSFSPPAPMTPLSTTGFGAGGYSPVNLPGGF